MLRDMPGVRDVRVLAAPDARRGQQIVACIVADAAQRLSVLAIRRFCSARLRRPRFRGRSCFSTRFRSRSEVKSIVPRLDDIVRHQYARNL